MHLEYYSAVKKKRTIDMHSNADEPQSHAEWKKPVPEHWSAYGWFHLHDIPEKTKL